MLRSVSLLALASAALAAQAGTFTFSGNLSDGVLNGSPNQNGNNPPTSTFPGSYNYTQLLFQVDTSGTYTFEVVTATFDSYAFLYLGPVDPAHPLTNILIGNDDGGTGDLSRFDYTLSAGTSYGYVVSTYLPEATGSFTATISGPGSISPNASSVPGPAAALPFALMALRRRKRA